MEEGTSIKRSLDDQLTYTSEFNKRPKTDDEETKTILENFNEDVDIVTATKESSTSSNPQKKKKNRRDDRRFQKKGKGKQPDKTVDTRKGTRPERSEADGIAVDQTPKGPRLPKRHCALLIGFCGTGCSGMQMYVLLVNANNNVVVLSSLASQRDARTIEGVLFESMVKVGAISEDNADNPGKVTCHYHIPLP
jgi:tRNA pseudouridine38-40 synthase